MYAIRTSLPDMNLFQSYYANLRKCKGWTNAEWWNKNVFQLHIRIRAIPIFYLPSAAVYISQLWLFHFKEYGLIFYFIPFKITTDVSALEILVCKFKFFSAQFSCFTTFHWSYNNFIHTFLLCTALFPCGIRRIETHFDVVHETIIKLEIVKFYEFHIKHHKIFLVAITFKNLVVGTLPKHQPRHILSFVTNRCCNKRHSGCTLQKQWLYLIFWNILIETLSRPTHNFAVYSRIKNYSKFHQYMTSIKYRNFIVTAR